MSKNDAAPKGTPKDAHYARLRRTHRDAKAGAAKQPAGGKPARALRPAAPGAPVADGLVLLYGLHTVRAAILNPNRTILSLSVTQNALARLDIGNAAALPFPIDLVSPRDLDALAGSDAVHQGAVALAEPLRTMPLAGLGECRLLLVLDQVTDPHNVGAILRSAVAFNVGAVITTSRHSPAETGVLAKAASGALEMIAHIEVRNLASALEEIAALGFRTIGLDSEGPAVLEETLAGERIALVLGAEGKGLRQKTRETVAALARLDMPGAIKSLNVSNAAAISLYAAHRHLSDTIR